jgi:hypothetical protein
MKKGQEEIRKIYEEISLLNKKISEIDRLDKVKIDCIIKLNHR